MQWSPASRIIGRESPKSMVELRRSSLVGRHRQVSYHFLSPCIGRAPVDPPAAFCPSGLRRREAEQEQAGTWLIAATGVDHGEPSQEKPHHQADRTGAGPEPLSMLVGDGDFQLQAVSKDLQPLGRMTLSVQRRLQAPTPPHARQDRYASSTDALVEGTSDIEWHQRRRSVSTCAAHRASSLRRTADPHRGRMCRARQEEARPDGERSRLQHR